uniref:aminoacyl tRNA synthase complex-interacting multifunctional protein 2-like isoform X1 n=1 Tax=Styela clava TaxID=7725 RepID=UPI001939AB80|nr:aminoacyl tRNA synthase complex-interacting multifunctional protein 2-like isoform X1 [Styela clava]
MAAVGTMYAVRPHYDVDGCVTTADIMYPVKRLYPPVTNLRQDKSLEERQESLLKKLDSLIATATARLGDVAQSTSNVTQSDGRFSEILQPGCPVDIVIRTNPANPPIWLNHVKNLLEDSGIRSWWKFHTHSSVRVRPEMKSFPASVEHEDRNPYQLIITVVWSDVAQCPSLHTSPCNRTPICGESNIFRFFARLFGVYDTSTNSDAVTDICLDACDVITSPSSSNQEKASTMKSISTAVEKRSWFGDHSSPLLESYVASVLANYGTKNIPQEGLKRWVTQRVG